jgi:quercetin dioxygenase-like cupin family protein
MANIEIKKLGAPDEVRPFVERGRVEILNFEEGTVGRAVFEPGWKWSEHVKPIAGTESCQSDHTGVVISGRMHVVMDDGQEADLSPGDIVHISPGHDAWTVGDEACVMMDFSGMGSYAKPREAAVQPSTETTPASVH